VKRRLRIGLSSCFFHSDPKRPIFKGKTLLYLEQSLSHWVMREGALAFMIPAPPKEGGLRLRDWAEDLDGLVLQGGSDVSPESYGEKAIKPEWQGDFVRDQYEIELFREFHRLAKPVLGVCRGAQLLNVAHGGTLIQDIGTQVPGARVHRDWEIYDQNFHNIVIERESELGQLYPDQRLGKVNSIHHQAIKDLGQGLSVEARSETDGIIEAIRGTEGAWVYAVQWHPEFQDPADSSLLDCRPILQRFLKEAAKASS
jgi:putative glutamine amidotransferase